MNKARILILSLSAFILITSCIYLPTRPQSPNILSDTSTLITGNGNVAAINSTGDINQPNTQVYFPRRGDKPELALEALYLSTEGNLDIAIYSLTHPVIVKAIGDAYKRGIKVRVITDKVQSSGATQKHAMNDLITIGIPIKIETHTGLMHLKMSIMDGKIATTGSYNYSKGASEDNDEMLVVINEPWFARICQVEFNRLWASPQFVDLQMSY